MVSHMGWPLWKQTCSRYGMNSEPFALQLYRRFLNGESIAALELDLGIPAERIEMRIRAAALFRESHPAASRHAA